MSAALPTAATPTCATEACPIPDCPECGAHGHIRNGQARGAQRYRCTACGHNYTRAGKRGPAPEQVRQAAVLHATGHSLRAIARALGVSHVTVRGWLQKSETPAVSLVR